VYSGSFSLATLSYSEFYSSYHCCLLATVTCEGEVPDSGDMFGSMQRSLFRFVGGYAIVDLYSNAVRVEPPVTVKSERQGWFSRTSAPPPSQQPRQFEEDTLRGDVETWIDENQVMALGIVCFSLLGGGPLSIAGAATSIAFDGDDGTDRYIALKDDLLDWWEGSDPLPPKK
jgi:hypothetical protein